MEGVGWPAGGEIPSARRLIMARLAGGCLTWVSAVIECFKSKEIKNKMVRLSLWFVAMFLAGAAVLSFSAAAQSGKAAKTAPVPTYGNADAIGEDELKAYLYFLASDQLEGRNLPSRGFDTAALYVASHLAEWGLKPAGSTTNTNGPLQPYFMHMELISKTVVPADSKASVTGPGAGGRGGAVLRAGRKMVGRRLDRADRRDDRATPMQCDLRRRRGRRQSRSGASLRQRQL